MLTGRLPAIPGIVKPAIAEANSASVAIAFWISNNVSNAAPAPFVTALMAASRAALALVVASLAAELIASDLAVAIALVLALTANASVYCVIVLVITPVELL